MKEKPLVSIVIPTHNRKEKLDRLLKSIFASQSPEVRLEVIVIDDTSTDGTFEDVKKNFPDVHLVRNNQERLLAGSRNVGIQNARGCLIFLIDDDNVVAHDTVSELASAMRRTAVLGVAAPLMYYLKDPSRVWCGRVKRNYVTSLTTFPERNQRDVRNDQILESDEFPNAFMVRREVIDKVGFFDEANFPIHNDEGDFCNRVRKAGFKIGLVPTAQVWHDTPLDSEKSNEARRFHVHTPERAFYTARSRVLFYRKYSRPMEFTIFLAFFMPLVSVLYLKAILADSNIAFLRRVQNARKYIGGTVEGLKPKAGV